MESVEQQLVVTPSVTPATIVLEGRCGLQRNLRTTCVRDSSLTVWTFGRLIGFCFCLEIALMRNWDI